MRQSLATSESGVRDVILLSEPSPKLQDPVTADHSSKGGSHAVNAAANASADADFFNGVLRSLEYHGQSELMSEAGSDHEEDHTLISNPSSRGKLSEDRMQDLLRRLRMRELPEVELAMQLLEHARDHLRDHGGTLVRISAPTERLVVVGDIHGHLNDLLHLLDAYGEPHRSNMYLFNGDFVDRGQWGPEVLFMIYALKLIHPNSVHLNRGNHESIACNKHYGFCTQLRRAYPHYHQEMYNLIQDTFKQLPICHVVGQKVFVVHGGIPLEPITLRDIERIPRGQIPIPGKTKEEKLLASFLWSDPGLIAGPSQRGAGCNFDENITRRFLSANGLTSIIRSHECVQHGHQEHHSGLVLTVFSASNYNKVADGNNACVVFVDSHLQITKGEQWNQAYVTRDCWKEDAKADERAMQTLHKRVSSFGPDVGSPQKRCLEELRRMIFLARTELLQAFEAADLKRNGRITPDRWADVMTTCLRTPADFPWLKLGPHLYSLDGDGSVQYIPFLFRYYNPFSRWMSEQWSRAMLGELSIKLGDNAAIKFECLDTYRGRRGSCTGLLTYAELRPLIDDHLPSSQREARHREMRVLALFRSMDTDKTGFVSREEFVDALEKAAISVAKCPRHHRLRESSPNFLQGCMFLWECDSCGREIAREVSRRTCSVCDYDLCVSCQGDRFVVEKQWDNIQDALNLLCRSHTDVHTLVQAVDGDGDGYVTKHEFVACFRDLTRGSSAEALALWQLAWDLYGQSCNGAQGSEKMPIAFFERCLAIVDGEEM